MPSLRSQPAYWLIKSEPGEFSIEDLKRKKRAHWDGVRNYEARNHLRRMKVGDLIVFYHSGGDVNGPSGIAKVVKSAYPDFTQWDRKSPHFDRRATRESPIWDMVDIAFVKAFARVIPREVLREVPALRDMVLWKRPRLSVTPLTRSEFDTIQKLGAKKE